jgi:hypothetical protein
MVYPDVFFHEKDPEVTRSPKGTDCFILGGRGSGKTTYLLTAAMRVMTNNPETDENNAHKAVWRGDSRRSGWLPFKHWTTLWLPENADVSATWMQEDDDGDDRVLDDADLEDVVREVRTYTDVKDLLDQLADHKAGTFNVIYPDPSFAGCEELTAETDRIKEPLPFVPKWEARGDDAKTPSLITDWWFGFLLGRVEYAPHVGWMALFFDEVGDWVPQSANNSDGNRLWDKIELLRSIWAESRRAKMSMYNAGHQEENVHEKIRREYKWRIQMPDETPNPISRVRGTYPVGFKRVPMDRDLMSYEKVGTGLLYNQTRFSYFSWEDVPDWPEDEDRWLRIRLGEPDDVDVAVEDDRGDDLELEFDERVFGEWQNATDHRLYVKQPGSGYVSVDTGRVVDELVSPVDGLTFVPETVREGEYREVRMRRDSDESELVVARIPATRAALSPGVGAGGDRS